jgi:hypothetical protein
MVFPCFGVVPARIPRLPSIYTISVIPPTKRNQVFERKKALKRNVATRQPARFVRRALCRATDLEDFELKRQTEQNLCRKSNNKNALSTFYSFSAEKTLIALDGRKKAFQVLQL